MLLGQNFGRRHERNLPAALDRLQRGERGDDRLAAADVTLQQPLHRRRTLEIVTDFPPHALLRAREPERNSREQRSGERTRAREHRRALRRAGLAMRLERQLLRDELVEFETRPRRMRALFERALGELVQARRRRMQKANRVAKLPQMPSLDQPFRERLRASAPDRRQARAR